jgi:hypothetical protein
MPKQLTAEHTPESLEAMAGALEEFAASIRVQAERLKLHNIERLEVANADQRKRGMVFIESFVSAVVKALRETREERGDFQPNGHTPPKKPKK